VTKYYGYGSYLSMERGCYVVKDKHGNISKYPMFENLIDEVVLKSGNVVTTGALTSLGWWETDVLFLTRKGRPVCMLKSLDDDSHVKTRLKQYEAFNNDKGFYIAKQIVLSRIKGQNVLLNKYGLKTIDINVRQLIDNVGSRNYRKRLMGIEGKFTENYFKQVLKLFPEKLRPKSRKKFRAYDGINNVLNLAYEVLGWKIHRALIKAKLEPFLGFLHSLQHGKPSLICDFKELYRYLIDDFCIQYCQGLNKKHFIMKTETVARKRKGKREYLKEPKTREMLKKLYDYFESMVDIPRIKHGKRQSIETLINEESLLLAKYIRDEIKKWIPRMIDI